MNWYELVYWIEPLGGIQGYTNTFTVQAYSAADAILQTEKTQLVGVTGKIMLTKLEPLKRLCPTCGKPQ
jgi:hypothetical protein